MDVFYSIAHPPAHVFRAYDIRGNSAYEITADVVYTLALKLSTQIEGGVFVARDGRLSGPDLVQALIAGLRDGGLDVVDLGCIPTPLLYYAATKGPFSGIMLTASHNPAPDNGLKMVVKGKPFFGDAILTLKDMPVPKLALQRGRYTKSDIAPDYIAQVKTKIGSLAGLSVVIDAGNGAAGPVSVALFKALGAEVTPLYCDIDGHFPNHHPDPSKPKNLADLMTLVQEKKADIGIAFDGDGDRLGVVTDMTEMVFPDLVLTLFAAELTMPAKVIYDVKCSRYVKEQIQKLGAQPIMSRTGHSFIKQRIEQENAALAGEMSGHFFMPQWWYAFDDALFAAAKLLQIVQKKGKLRDLLAQVPPLFSTPEINIAVPEADKKIIMEKLSAYPFAGEKITIDGIRVEYADGWCLVRPSNTTATLVVRVEGFTAEAKKRIQNELQNALKAASPLELAIH